MMGQETKIYFTIGFDKNNIFIHPILTSYPELFIFYTLNKPLWWLSVEQQTEIKNQVERATTKN